MENFIENLNCNWQDLDEELIFILGRPNFALGKIAHRMREMGYQCDTKSEKEQAMVIHIMLRFYGEFGSDWKEEFNNYLKTTLKPEFLSNP